MGSGVVAVLRSFGGAFAPRRGPDVSRLLESLRPEGDPRLLELGPLAVAYTGRALPARAPEAPACVLDGTVYEVIGLNPPARSGPELEAFLADAWRRDGEALLTRLRGEFALLLFDPGEQHGLLVRDQMGGRGAMWRAADDGVAFATDVRPLVAALPRRPSPDPVALAHWLAMSGFPGDRSLFEGVRRIQAGCALRFGPSGAMAFRYWSPAPSAPERGEPGEHAAALRDALERSIRRRTAPDERTGVLLSGGLDSGSVYALAVREPPESRPRSAYSAVFPKHPSVDESDLISELTSKLGVPATTIRVDGGSVFQGALAYLERFEVPPVSPNLFFWIPLMRRAAEDGMTAMLDGEGGDEIFGYSAHLVADRVARGRLLSAVRLVRDTPYLGGSRSPRAIYAVLRAYGLKGVTPYWLHNAVRSRRAATRYAPSWMRPEMARAYADSDDNHEWKREPGPRWFSSLLHRTALGMGPRLGYDHMRRRALLAGLEPRHPLVDVDVVELVLGFPPELAFDRERSRPVLRASVAGLLPDSVRLRPTKSNFDAVFHEALAGVDLPVARALLGRDDAEVGAYVDLAPVRKMLDGAPENRHARMWWALHVWRLATAECWLLQQGDPAAIRRIVGDRLALPQVELSPPVGVS